MENIFFIMALYIKHSVTHVQKSICWYFKFFIQDENMLSLRTKILLTVLIFVTVIGVGFVFYSIFTTKSYKQLRLEGLEFKIETKAETINKSIRKI